MSIATPRTLLLVRIGGLSLVGLFLVLVGRFWHPVYGLTALIQLDAPNDDLKLAAFREHPVFVHREHGGYDGLYYAQIALDPTLRDPGLPRAIDNLSYRARRILPPALAWAGGWGRPDWIIRIYPWLNVIAWLALAAVLWRLLDVTTLRGLVAWIGVLFSAGALASVRLALTDLIALALLAGALLAAERLRGRAGVACLSLAVLSRETSVLGLAGLLTRPWFSRRNIAAVVAVAAPLALWLAYVRWRVGPADAGWSNLTLPVVGWIEKLIASTQALQTVQDRPLAWTTFLATLALSVQALYVVTRWQWTQTWWRLGAAYTLLFLTLGTAVWEGFPGAATRVLLPLTLAFNVLVHRQRASWIWLLAGNLAVFAGLLALRDVHPDPREMAARKTGELAVVVRLGDGWYGREQHRNHTWAWSAQRATLEVETWPRIDAEVTLEVSLRSLAPTALESTPDAHPHQTLALTPTRTPHNVTLTVHHGHGRIDFQSTTPPRPESPAPDARPLGFAVYDVKIVTARPLR
ncbi:MAG: hypothetical protein JNN01_13020 [Opitutaceae bacterium]|nr:hypothetical protein [Opitutaceae bacterium]